MKDWEKVFEKASDAYKKKFGESLPTEMMPSGDLENIEEIVRECLKTGKPYELSEEIQELLKLGAVF